MEETVGSAGYDFPFPADSSKDRNNLAQIMGHGLYEMRTRYGPGYRVYYGKEGSHLLLLLCGGSKPTQRSDIRLANKYWQDYQW